jgi:hypothetical protein
MVKRRRAKHTIPVDATVWRKVDVGLDGADDKNHYDDDELKSHAPKDLEAVPGEHVGMFFGLEMIDPKDYMLVEKDGIKKFHVKGETEQYMEEHDDEPAEDAVPEETGRNDETHRTKRKKKEDKKKKSKKQKITDPNDHKPKDVDEQQVQTVQSSWLAATGGVTLHPDICKGLVRQGFWTPTPIQAATLPASILGRRNIVGAAPTGSGKLELQFYLLDP